MALTPPPLPYHGRGGAEQREAGVRVILSTRHSWKLLFVILLPLHGSVGYWDEIACLALPATVIMGVALALFRQEQKQGFDAHTEENTDEDEVAGVERDENV